MTGPQYGDPDEPVICTGCHQETGSPHTIRRLCPHVTPVHGARAAAAPRPARAQRLPAGVREYRGQQASAGARGSTAGPVGQLLARYAELDRLRMSDAERDARALLARLEGRDGW